MEPIGGLKRKRKKAEKKIGRNVFASQHQPLDWWDNFSKRITGPLSQSRNSNDFESFFNISRKTFNYICSLVKQDMMDVGTFIDNKGKLLSLNDRVAVALGRLSFGKSLTITGESFGLNQRTVNRITWRFVESMEERGLCHLHWPSTEAEMEDIKSKFEKICGLPNCCGAIDTTHIIMCLSTTDQTKDTWCDHEKNHSMVLQAIVDTDMRFLDIVTGWPGSLSDSKVLKSSGFFKLCEEGKRLDGKKIVFSKGRELREYIVGDGGFPLLPWLLTPYQGKGISEFQSKFNEQHLAAQKVAERALTRLKERWRIIQGVLQKPDKNKVPRIVFVCCLLHNILIDSEDNGQNGEMPVSHAKHDFGYPQQICKSIDRAASAQRDMMSLLLSVDD